MSASIFQRVGLIVTLALILVPHEIAQAALPSLASDIAVHVPPASTGEYGSLRPALNMGAIGYATAESMVRESSTPLHNVVSLLQYSTHSTVRVGGKVRRGPGYPASYTRLAMMHSHGIQVARSEAKAVLFHTFASLAGSPESSAALSYRYERGINVPVSVDQAAIYARLAAEKVAKHYRLDNRISTGDVRLSDTSNSKGKDALPYHVFFAEKGSLHSKMSVGYAHLYGQNKYNPDSDAALRYFKEALDEGHPPAYGALGQLYAHGMSNANPPIKANPHLSQKYFEEGAARGDPSSFNGLGYYHASEAAKATDTNKAHEHFSNAASWFTKAAVAGNSDGMYNLGVLKLVGKGVPKSVDGALDLLSKAASGGSVLAHWQLGLLSLSGSSSIPRSSARALSFFRHVLRYGPWQLRMREGYDAYTSKNYRLALYNYLVVAETGGSTANANVMYLLQRDYLGEIELYRYTVAPKEEVAAKDVDTQSVLYYGNTTFVRLSQIEALDDLLISLTNRAALDGDRGAQLFLGDYFYYRLNNQEKALELYQQASYGNDGVAQAMFNVGYMYHYGEGTSTGQPDYHLALRYYDAALQRSKGDGKYAVMAAQVSLNFHYWMQHFGPYGGFGSISFSIPTVMWVPLDDFIICVLIALKIGLLLLRNHLAING